MPLQPLLLLLPHPPCKKQSTTNATLYDPLDFLTTMIKKKALSILTAMPVWVMSTRLHEKRDSEVVALLFRYHIRDQFDQSRSPVAVVCSVGAGPPLLPSPLPSQFYDPLSVRYPPRLSLSSFLTLSLHTLHDTANSSTACGNIPFPTPLRTFTRSLALF
jgi:hypothetical protein